MSANGLSAAAAKPLPESPYAEPESDNGLGAMASGNSITVILIDDQGLFREGLARLLATEIDIDVLGTASSDRAAAVIRQNQPDVVLLGADDVDELAEQLARITQVAPMAKIILLASQDDPRRVKHFLSSGAHAYMMKRARIDELLTTIRVVDRDQNRVVLSVSRQAANRLQTDQDMPLSGRELEVLGLVADGMRNSQIAGRLFIAEGTVKRHLTNIYSKLGATSRTDAVRKAARQGLSYD